MGPPTDLGEHPHEVPGRLALRNIDDLVAFQDGEVDRLTELVDGLGEEGVRPRGAMPMMVMTDPVTTGGKNRMSRLK